MPEILHDRLPLAPWMEARTLRLPGTQPIAPADWLQRDEVFAAQMEARDRLIAERPEAVLAMEAGARAAAEELLATVLDHVEAAPGYRRAPGEVLRPDGARVPLDGEPLAVAGRLVQEDLCLLEKAAGEAEHRLTGAVLCFPSNWTLAEKIGKPLGRIHLPVARYDAETARRVQRLFDAVRPEAPLMRANFIPYAHAELHSPRREFARHSPAPQEIAYVRVERQTILRLPVSRAVVFSIHVYQAPLATIAGPERTGIEAARPDWFTPPGPAA